MKDFNDGQNKKKKGILASILESMLKTGGCCGSGESCCCGSDQDKNKQDKNKNEKNGRAEDGQYDMEEKK